MHTLMLNLLNVLPSIDRALTEPDKHSAKCIRAPICKGSLMELAIFVPVSLDSVDRTKLAIFILDFGSKRLKEGKKLLPLITVIRSAEKLSLVAMRLTRLYNLSSMTVLLLMLVLMLQLQWQRSLTSPISLFACFKPRFLMTTFIHTTTQLNKLKKSQCQILLEKMKIL